MRYIKNHDYNSLNIFFIIYILRQKVMLKALLTFTGVRQHFLSDRYYNICLFEDSIKMIEAVSQTIFCCRTQKYKRPNIFYHLL